MTHCLNDIQIQAVVDGEADAAERAHAAACSACAARLARRQQQTAAIEQALNAPTTLPEPLTRRVEDAFRTDAADRGGATRLRNQPRSPRPPADGRRRWILSGFAVAAATVIAVLFVVPAVRRPDATVSAAEILAKSANQLAAAPSYGVETFVYELVLDGVPRDVMPDHANGAYHVRQVIDHSVPGRYLLASYDQSGTLISSVSQDPATHRRVMAMRVDDQPYRFEMTLPAS
jgi:hypothetical protein